MTRVTATNRTCVEFNPALPQPYRLLHAERKKILHIFLFFQIVGIFQNTWHLTHIIFFFDAYIDACEACRSKAAKPRDFFKSLAFATWKRKDTELPPQLLLTRHFFVLGVVLPVSVGLPRLVLPWPVSAVGIPETFRCQRLFRPCFWNAKQII